MIDPRQEAEDPKPEPASIGPVRRFGRYTLVKKIATGGMAEIYLARQRGLAGFNRFVVIKKILPHLSEQATFVTMFQDEARTSSQLNHPNIVQIYDLGRESDSYFIAMEYIAGENLAAIAWRGMKRGHPFPPAFAARVIADSCKALHYAHHLKGADGKPLEIVHRDISPQNILVTYEGEVKVVDFGIAKAATKSEHTKTGMLKGKFSYMSPEQCHGIRVDMRSDMFSLGILLYELCAGKRLFKHESELMILEMITKRSVVPPSQVAPGISAELEYIIMKALEKDPLLRFQTGQEMQVALEDCLRHEGHHAGNADIAAYMRDLFTDKIEEKQRLKELASREDFDAQFGADEGTAEDDPDHRRRRVVHGLPPSQVQVRGLTPAGSLLPQGSPAGGLTPTSSMPGGQPYPGGRGAPHPAHSPYAYEGRYAGSIEALAGSGSGWVARLIVVSALVIITLASAILYQHYLSEPESLPEASSGDQALSLPRKTGSLMLESVPQGAVIVLDGRTMTLPSGEPAKTPSDLTSLLYATAYQIRLEKDGYRPFETTISMGESTDGSTIRPDLEAFPGRLIAEVRGPKNDQVRLYFNGEDVGMGPRVSREVAGNTAVLVKADLAGYTCRADPPRARVAPNQTEMTTVSCEVEAPPPRTARRRPARASKAPDPSAAASSGCQTNPDLPQGFVTISTQPYAEIFWNGRRLGETPLSRHKLPSGCVVLKAVNTSLGKERTVQVEVEPNRVRIYKFDLDG